MSDKLKGRALEWLRNEAKYGTEARYAAVVLKMIETPRTEERDKAFVAWIRKEIPITFASLWRQFDEAPRSPQQALTKARIDEAHSYFSKTAAEQGADHGEQYGFKHRLYAQGVEECYICALLRENTELRANAKEKP